MTTPTAKGAGIRLAALIIALALPARAAAQATVPQGYSVDVEFMHPSFGYGAFPGVDVPMTRAPLAWRYGALVQYENDPVTAYDAIADVELGSAVTTRVDAQLGLSLDLSDRFAMGLRVPMGLNRGFEVPEFAAEGFGVGDLGVGGKIIAIKTRRDLFNAGVRLGLSLPTGRQNFYLGERNVRAESGLLATTNLGPVRVSVDSGVLLRGGPPVATSEDFVIGHEWRNGVGARVALPDATRLALTVQGLHHTSLDPNLFLRPGAENAVEAVGGIQILPSRPVVIDVGAGRGFSEGFGTTDLRIQSMITVQHVPRPEQVVVIEPPPPPPPPPPPVIEELPEPEPEWEEGEVARVVMDQIQIREQLEFYVDTANLKPESKPILEAVADIINSSAQIGHVVIEGHASQEGSYEYNYDLSERRARAIFEELIKLGVHPSRISYRSMGEVVPLPGNTGTDEASLQKNRRVEFHIVKQYESVEDMPTYSPSFPLPWSGEIVPIKIPPKPEPEKEKKDEEKEVQVDEFGLPISEGEAIEIEGTGGDEGGEEGE